MNNKKSSSTFILFFVVIYILGVCGFFGFKYINKHFTQNGNNKFIQKIDKKFENENPWNLNLIGYDLYCKGEYDKALPYFLKAAEQNQVNALNNLGCMYLDGQGVEKNHNKAVEYFRKSAELGHPNAQYNMGLMYLQGLGVNKDYNQAIRWFQKAGGQQSLKMIEETKERMKKEGIKIEDTLNIEQDIENMNDEETLLLTANNYVNIKEYDKAFRYYKKAAEKGNPMAQNIVGRFYHDGLGIQKDYKKAIEFFTKSAEKGNDLALNNLGWMYLNGDGIDKDYKTALKLFVKSAEKGNSMALNNLGWMYLNGNGVDKDYKTAFDLFTKSAEKGNKYAMNNLSDMYKNGYGVEKDLNKAKEWKEKAEK